MPSSGTSSRRFGSLVHSSLSAGHAITEVPRARGLPCSPVSPGVAAAVVLLARFMIEAMISLDTTLAILGIAAIVVGTLRVVGAFRDEPGDRPRPALRLVLGASEIGIGVVWIAVDDVSRTVTVVGGLCALVVGTSMLVGALDLRRRSLPGVRP